MARMPLLGALGNPRKPVRATDGAPQRSRGKAGPGFVVIHATDAEGKPLVPGSIGAAPIPGGQSRNIAIALTEPVDPGDRLIAMLYFDSGQPGVYEFGTSSIAEDKPVMHQGKPVTAVIVLD